MLKIESVDPMREHARKDMAEPKFKKSRTDNEAPNSTDLNTETVAPKRKKLRKEREEPNCKKSNTANDDPSRTKLRKD